MQESIRDWLVQAGFPEEIELAPLGSGLGSTTLWTFVPAPNAAPLLARVFREGGERVANREYLAMRAAAAHGIPVPTVVTRGVVSNRPLLVTTFAAGTPVSQALVEDPRRVHELGVRMGEAMGRLHQVVAPEGLVPRADAWIDRGGPALAPIRPLLATIPNGDRLLHLDYHPDNVLVDGRTVTAIIDWENTMAGPPHIDLARTRAILHAAKVSGRLPEGQQVAVDRLVDGIVQGHATVIGPDPHPALSAAWASAMTADDLAGHLGKPGSWITEAFLD
ncbi:MAG TPA: phosphotransferase, partial [Thermomicrobiales bacterium]|nr:phosphotransferase [Thermomicrobiales bacterium]